MYNNRVSSSCERWGRSLHPKKEKVKGGEKVRQKERKKAGGSEKEGRRKWGKTETWREGRLNVYIYQMSTV